MHFLRASRFSAWLASAFFGILFFIVPVGLLAQTGTSGTIAGVVKDPSAAVVANAVVTAPDREVGAGQAIIGVAQRCPPGSW